MKKNILITGSNGFIGKSIIEKFDKNHKNHYNIFALDYENEFTGNISMIIEYYKVDISKPFKLNENFDVIIHLAALNQTNINCDFSYNDYNTINVIGTKNLIASCNFNKFIYFSTANLYDRDNNDLNGITENSPIKPKSYYEKSKYNAELICKEFIDNNKLVILRPVNIVGIKQKNKALIPFCFSNAMKNENINIFVPINRKMQILSTKDIFSALLSIIEMDSINGIFNLSSSEYIEIAQLVQRIVNLCNSKSQITFSNVNKDNEFIINSCKANKTLNWKETSSINSILSDYLKGIKEIESSK